ncbi:MAG: ABC transporter permease [Conexibacter sp.]
MRHAFAGELLKLRTTRTFVALVASAVLLTVVLTTLAASLAKYHAGDFPPGEDLVGLAFFGLLFAFVLGLLAVTTEFRHGTITPTLLAIPSRSRLIAAKLAAHLLAGGVLGLLTVVLNLALVEAILSLRDIETGTSLADALRWIAGGTADAALFAGLGVGVGAVVRHQVGALVGGLAWLFVVEPLLTIVPGLDDVIAKLGVGGLSDGLDGYAMDGSNADLLAQLPAGLVLAAYVALAALAGAALLRRRDVTA